MHLFSWQKPSNTCSRAHPIFLQSAKFFWQCRGCDCHLLSYFQVPWLTGIHCRMTFVWHSFAWVHSCLWRMLQDTQELQFQQELSGNCIKNLNKLAMVCVPSYPWRQEEQSGYFHMIMLGYVIVLYSFMLYSLREVYCRSSWALVWHL